MRWPLGGRRRGRPVLPTRHPAPPAAPPTQALPPRPTDPPTRPVVPAAAAPSSAPQATQPAPRVPAPPPAGRPAPPPPPPPQANHQPAAPARPVPPPPPVPAATPTPAPSPEPPAGDGDGAAALPRKPPPAAPDTEDRPATVGDVRSLRRWLIVTAVWAVAATAIAVLAYLSANDDDEAQIADAGARASAVQRRVNQQVRELDQRLANLPQSTEVEGLDERLKRIEKVFSRQDRQLVSVGTQLKEIDTRLNALEDEAPADGQNTTTTP